MGIFLLFTFLVFPILLGALSHFFSAFFHHQKQKQQQQDKSLTNKAAQPLIQPHKSLPHLIIEAKRFRRKPMDEKQTQKMIERKVSLGRLNMEEVHKQAQEQPELISPLASPFRSPLPRQLTKSASSKFNCLCAPTTHAGSFRCRLHRNGSSFRRLSVGSGLNELDAKSSLTAITPLETS